MNPLLLPDNLDQVISGRVIDDIINIFFDYVSQVLHLFICRVEAHARTGLPTHSMPPSSDVHRELDS